MSPDLSKLSTVHCAESRLLMSHGARFGVIAIIKADSDLVLGDADPSPDLGDSRDQSEDRAVSQLTNQRPGVVCFRLQIRGAEMRSSLARVCGLCLWRSEINIFVRRSYIHLLQSLSHVSCRRHPAPMSVTRELGGSELCQSQCWSWENGVGDQQLLTK